MEEDDAFSCGPVGLACCGPFSGTRSRQLDVALGSFSSTGLELTLDLLHPVTVTAGNQAGPPPVWATCPLSAVAPYRVISHCGFCFSIHSHGFTLKVSLSTVCSLLTFFRVWNRMQTSEVPFVRVPCFYTFLGNFSVTSSGAFSLDSSPSGLCSSPSLSHFLSRSLLRSCHQDGYHVHHLNCEASSFQHRLLFFPSK